MLDMVIKSNNVYIEDRFEKACVGISDGKIVSVSLDEHTPDAKEVLELGDKYLIPGTIDTHMHVRDPGHTERGNFYTETMAAAAGGVTTIMEHPISMPPQYSVEILNNRIERADTQSVVDFCFYGAAGAEFPEEITKLAADGKIVAFKSFLHAAPEGRDAEFKGLTMANDAELFIGMTELAKTGLITAFHAENNDMIQYSIKMHREQGKTLGIHHATSRPPFTEISTVERVIRFAKETGARVEIAHVSTPQAMEMIKEAKQEGYEIYAETCPHYLFLTEKDLEKHGAFAKCNPPLRSKELSDKLWDFVNDGTVDYIGSDHSPFLLSEKESGKDDVFKAVAGFPGVDLRLPLMLDAVADGKIKLEKVVELLVVNPAKYFNIYPQKGTISLGADADFAVFNFDEKTVVDKNKCYSQAKDIAVPYDGKELKVKLDYTILRGEVIMEDGIVGESYKAYGKLVTPNKPK